MFNTTIVERGVLIVFEGCDRSGKTTQSQKLLETLNANNIKTYELLQLDRTTTIGSIIDKYLRKELELNDREVHLLFSANRWAKCDEMFHDLNNGISLIIDRYIYSGIAFTAAKGFNLNWCRACDIGLPEPDVVLYLDINHTVLNERKDFGAERYEYSEFQNRVSQIFSLLHGPKWISINASKTPDEISLQISQIITTTISVYKKRPIATIN